MYGPDPAAGEVLDILTKGLNGLQGASRAKLWQSLLQSQYHANTKAALGVPDDEDWQDVESDRNDQSWRPVKFTRSYDKEDRTMYYVETEPSERAAEDSSGMSDSNDLSCQSGQEPKPHLHRAAKIIDRLVPGNGCFAPYGYQQWLHKKLQGRLGSVSDIPGYGHLCSRCEKVLTNSMLCFKSGLSARTDADFMNKDLKWDVFGHHKTLGALHASASAGCHLCSLLDALFVGVLNTDGCNATYCLVIRHPYGYRFSFQVHTAGQELIQMDCGLEQPEIGPSTLHCSSTASPEVMALAQGWLARCLEKDKDTCPTSSGFLPSRLIQISTVQGMVQSARLVLRDELPTPTSYLTLSHCWGKVQMAVLLHSTYQTYRSDIPLSILSKTFRDALQVTASLGYEYLWIDSLCIQQDSDWDWAKEAATMGDVYRQSTCTLAATGAKDGRGGLFRERPFLAITPCALFKWQNKKLSCACPHVIWPKPLNERAWAVQERCLSPRTLSFGIDKISWTCRYGGCCEGPNAHSMKLDDHAFSKLLDGRVDEKSANDVWEAIVESYSRCKLAFWKDRWPAFQGLASQVSTAQDWKIVHGLRHHLLGSTGLLWEVESRESGTVDCGEPSWSWLNIKGGIGLFWLPSKHYNADFTVEESSTSSTYMDEPTTILRITACMIEFESSSVVSEFEAYVDCNLTVSNPSYNPKSSNRLLHGRWSPDTVPVCDTRLWAVQILGGYEYSLMDGKYQSFGIVVVAVEGRPGFWRRVGWYTNWSTYQYRENEACPFGREKSTIFLV